MRERLAFGARVWLKYDVGSGARPVPRSPSVFPRVFGTGRMMDAFTMTALPADVPPAVARRSICADCQVEANRFKWIESEKAGHDLGESAIRRWICDHWWGYLRARWLEHLHGKCFWIELNCDTFGIVQQKFQDHKDLLTAVVDKLKLGQENLEILVWAVNCGIPISLVIDILEALDINSLRLVRGFDAPPDRSPHANTF